MTGPGTTDDGSAAAAARTATDEVINRAVQLTVSAFSQTTIVVGSLFYFGYVRASSTFGYLGLDVTLLGFSTVDYVLRSGNSVLVPVLVLACSLLYLRFVAELLRRLFELRPPGAERRGWLAWSAGAATVSIGVGALPAAAWWALNGTVAARVFVLFLLVAGLVSLVTGPGGGAAPGRVRALATPLTIPLGAIAVALFFYATALQAQDVGTRIGREVEQGITARPGVVVFAETTLGMTSGHRLVVEPLAGVDERYRYRIVGLRLLIAANERYFLLRPKESSHRFDVVVVPAAEVRIDVTG